MSDGTGETIHATCVMIGGHGLLLAGPSGSGKSDLALRLIDRGARLVSDDYTLVRASFGRLIATAPRSITGKLEVRGIGIIDQDNAAPAEVGLMLLLDEEPERLPPENVPTRVVAGVALPAIGFRPFEASAPIKAEMALRLFGVARVAR